MRAYLLEVNAATTNWLWLRRTVLNFVRLFS
jgi:hypothetical protein